MELVAWIASKIWLIILVVIGIWLFRVLRRVDWRSMMAAMYLPVLFFRGQSVARSIVIVAMIVSLSIMVPKLVWTEKAFREMNDFDLKKVQQEATFWNFSDKIKEVREKLDEKKLNEWQQSTATIFALRLLTANVIIIGFLSLRTGRVRYLSEDKKQSLLQSLKESGYIILPVVMLHYSPEIVGFLKNNMNQEIYDWLLGKKTGTPILYGIILITTNAIMLGRVKYHVSSTWQQYVDSVFAEADQYFLKLKNHFRHTKQTQQNQAFEVDEPSENHTNPVETEEESPRELVYPTEYDQSNGEPSKSQENQAPEEYDQLGQSNQPTPPPVADPPAVDPPVESQPATAKRKQRSTSRSKRVEQPEQDGLEQ